MLTFSDIHKFEIDMKDELHLITWFPWRNSCDEDNSTSSHVWFVDMT